MKERERERKRERERQKEREHVCECVSEKDLCKLSDSVQIAEGEHGNIPLVQLLLLIS